MFHNLKFQIKERLMREIFIKKTYMFIEESKITQNSK